MKSWTIQTIIFRDPSSNVHVSVFFRISDTVNYFIYGPVISYMKSLSGLSLGVPSLHASMAMDGAWFIVTHRVTHRALRPLSHIYRPLTKALSHIGP